jgi:YfiH family protein
MNSQVLVKEPKVYLFGNLFPHSISLGFTSRQDGNMSFSHGDASDTRSNRERFLQQHNIDASRLVCARQVHGDSVTCVSAADAGRGWDTDDTSIPDSDALITDRRRVPLAVFTADCLPVFLYDAQNQVIALVHAGWRGTQENIAGKTVHAMMKHYGCQPENIYAGFGPAIRGCCYEVGEEFTGRFKHGLICREERYYLDLVKANKEQLRSREVKTSNMFDSGICTVCRNDEYFSYRREGTSCARAMSVLAIR